MGRGSLRAEEKRTRQPSRFCSRRQTNITDAVERRGHSFDLRASLFPSHGRLSVAYPLPLLLLSQPYIWMFASVESLLNCIHLSKTFATYRRHLRHIPVRSRAECIETVASRGQRPTGSRGDAAAEAGATLEILTPRLWTMARRVALAEF